MAVLHVFAKANVGDDQQSRQFLFQQAHGLLHDAVGGVSAGGAWASLVSGMPNSSTAGTPSCAPARPRAQVHPAKVERRRAWHRWGGAACVRRGRKSGRTSWATFKWVSLTSRRSAGDWRRRRGRHAGKLCPQNAFSCGYSKFKVESSKRKVGGFRLCKGAKVVIIGPCSKRGWSTRFSSWRSSPAWC